MERGYIDMVGDLFHYGHVEQCKKAKNQGYYLIVGVHNDDTVESYKRRPILSMDDRIRVIEACRYVDEVIPNAPLEISKQYLDKHSIDMVFHGHSLEEDEKYKFMYKEACQLGKFTRTDYTPGISTTNIIENIVVRYS